VGACLVTEKIAAHIKENDLGTTFGGGMIAMAAVVGTLEAIEADGMLTNVCEVESYLRERLQEVEQVVAWAKDHYRNIERSEGVKAAAAVVFAEGPG
jgi:acetylornithine/succinyldiaminopimelate/putrescine aminotransferase